MDHHKFIVPDQKEVHPVNTPGGRQSKTPILLRNVDQKSIETVFLIAPTGDKCLHCFYRFLIRVCRLLITFSIVKLTTFKDYISKLSLPEVSV